MPSLRLLYSNAADRATTLTASTEAGTLVVENLLTDIKAEKWRATTTSATLTLEWTTAEIIGVVALPFCNLSTFATIRVRGYTNTADVVAAVDTGTVYACPNTVFDTMEWGMQPLGEATGTYSEVTYANVWVSPTNCKKIVIDIVDTDNEDLYIEASKLVLGTYWEPVLQVGFGVNLIVTDTSKQLRSDAGDLIADPGTKSRKISLDVSNMEALDRFRITEILWGNGMTNPVYFSLSPDNEDHALEQYYQIYGRFSAMSGISITTYKRYNIPLTIEEM